MSSRSRARERARTPVVAIVGLVASLALPPSATANPPAVEAGRFDGSLHVPGTDTSLGLGGYLKLDVIYSSTSSGGAGGSNLGDQFLVPRSIPVPEPAGEDGQLTMHPRESRIWFKTLTETTHGDVGTYLELDFFAFQAPGDERVSNSYAPRLRHAYGTFGPLTAGQTWTTFMNVAALPELNDFVGPVSAVFVRQPELRLTLPLAPDDAAGSISFAIESPETTITNPEGVRVTPDDDRVPDLVLRWDAPARFGSLSVAGILRELRSDGAVVESATDGAWAGGVNVAGRVRTVGLDDLRFSLVWGEGLGRYVGLNAVDGAIARPDGELELVPLLGGHVAYRHWWDDRWRSTVLYSLLLADPPSDASGAVTERVQAVHANLMWSPVLPFTVGIEGIWAERRIADGRVGNLLRAQLSTTFLF